VTYRYACKILRTCVFGVIKTHRWGEYVRPV
jgi:hypothetical protein